MPATRLPREDTSVPKACLLPLTRIRIGRRSPCRRRQSQWLALSVCSGKAGVRRVKRP